MNGVDTPLLRLDKARFMIAFVAFYLLSVYPILFVKYVPFHDLPEHLAAGAALKDIITGGPLSANFRFEGFFPNLFGWVLIAVLNVFFDILTTAKLLVLIYFLITPLSIYYYLDDDKKPLSLLSFLFLNSYALNMGFVNYLFSMPLIFLALGAYNKQSKLFYPFCIMAYASHAISYLFYVTLLCASYFAKEKRDNNPVVFAVFLLLLLPLLPSPEPNPAFHAILSPAGSVPRLLDYALGTFYGNLFYSSQTFISFRPDYPSLTAFILVAALYAKQLLIDHNYSKRGLYTNFAAMLFVAFCPMEINPGSETWLGRGRFLSFAALFVMADLRLTNRIRNLMVALFLLLVLVNSTTLSSAYAQANERLIRNYEPVLDALPPKGRVFILEETPWPYWPIYISKNTYGISPYRHFLDSYYSLKGGLASGYYGAGMLTRLQWPVTYANKLYYPLCDYSEDSVPGKSCINCSEKDVNCFLEDPVIQKNFDYLLVYSSDGIDPDNFVGSADWPIILSTDDAIICRLGNAT